jgi:hypothetical protein
MNEENTSIKKLKRDFNRLFNSRKYQNEQLQIMAEKGLYQEDQINRIRYLFSDEFIEDFYKACILLEKENPNIKAVSKQVKIINLKLN